MKKLIGSLLIAIIAQNLNAAEVRQSSSVFSKKQKFDQEGVELYNNNLDLKSAKRIGIGLAAGGMMGLVGVNGEMNVEPENAIFAGVGVGKGYNTINFGWKKNFEGYYMSPYTKVGYSRWFDSTSGSSDDTRGNYILNRILNDNEIFENKFSVSFLTGSLGLEYNQLEGDLSGVNLFGEIQMMADFVEARISPTASIGVTYFY